jgi:hypothetical protein
MAQQPLRTHKITPEAHALLKQLARQTGEKEYALLERLLRQEAQRLEHAATTRPDWNRL